MLESAFLHELFAWDVIVLVRHAHCEAKIDLGVWVLAGGAEFEHVAQALLGSVHAGHAVVVVGDAGYVLVRCWSCEGVFIASSQDLPSDVRQLEVDLVADILHGRQDHVMQAVSRIRALRHDERFERHPARAVRCVILIPDIDCNH